MKVTDRMGNELRDGDTIYWTAPDGRVLLAHVKNLVEPGLISDTHGEKVDGKIHLEIELNLPYRPQEQGKPFVCGDFLKGFDPKSKITLARAVGTVAEFNPTKR